MKPLQLTEPDWHWPLTLAAYDFTAPLTPTEKRTLTTLVALREQPHRVLNYADIAHERLPRLVQPVRDALTKGGFAAEHHSAVVYRFLKASADHSQPFGRLTENDWLSLLESDTHGTLSPAMRSKSGHPFLVTLYLLGCFHSFHRLQRCGITTIACTLFGESRLRTAHTTVGQALTALGYHDYSRERIETALTEILLVQRSPRLADIDTALLEEMRATTCKPNASRYIVRIAYGLFGLGLLKRPLSHTIPKSQNPQSETEWEVWCRRWDTTSTLTPASRRGILNVLLQVGHWLSHDRPAVTSPSDWDRQTCLDFIAAVCALHHGEWTKRPRRAARGELLQASSRRKRIDAVRTFFHDLQAWDWIPKRFNPAVSLTAPAYLHAQIGPNPRLIARDQWAALLRAALALTEADLQPHPHSRAKQPNYPLTMVRAVALIWVFGGLRNDEIRRLRVGCVRWEEDAEKAAADAVRPVVSLRVPVNKTSGSFEKLISRTAAEALREWEQARPPAPSLLDAKTGERAQFLFVYRGRMLGRNYLNHQLIPKLCAKADIPLADGKGNITSHRARATLSSELIQGEAALTLSELKTWLGHRALASTLHYVKPTLTRVTQAYTETDYFRRNLRLVDVLVDEDALRAGETLHWLHYDLGHGYCTHDFFAQCAHRMACARCSFYLPKTSSQAQILEAKTHLRHMMQEIELTSEELSAVEGDLQALDRLLETLRQAATPDTTTGEQPS